MALEAHPYVPQNRPLAAIGWMLLSGLCFVGVTALVKMLGDAVPPAQAAFVRYLIGVLFLIPLLPRLRAANLSGQALRLFGLRGLIHSLGVICWFYAMTRITIAEVTAMQYLSPVYVTLGAAVFLGERLQIRRLAAVGAALVGMVIILRPGFRELGMGHLAILFTGLSFAASYLIAKRMTVEASPTVVVAALSLTVTVGLAPFAAAVWVPIGWVEIGWLTVVAVLATAGHYAMTYAFRAAPLAVTQPVTFLQLIWAVALGAVAFAEPVDGWVVTGGVIIVAAVSFIAWRESRLRLGSSR